jgi:hypothetical protein
VKVTRKAPFCGSSVISTANTIRILMTHRKNEYHLIRIDLSKDGNQNNLALAIQKEYDRYRSPVWRKIIGGKPLRLKYVRVSIRVKMTMVRKVTDFKLSMHLILRS